MDLFYKHFITNEGYKVALTGLRNTLIIAVAGLFIGIVIGSVIALFNVAAKRNKVAKAISCVCNVYTAVFRGTPIVVQLLIAHFVLRLYVSFPSPWEAAIVFGLNSGAYVSEIMRGGINSVDVGQLEAGRTLGLSYTATMIKIVLPQAIKNVIPTLGNELIALVKDTSVASYVTTVDLTYAFTRIGDATFDYMIPYLFLALAYFILVIVISLIVRLIERRLAKSEKK